MKNTDGQTLEWKELIFIKGTKEQFLPIRKEPMCATSIGKEGIDPQIQTARKY